MSVDASRATLVEAFQRIWRIDPSAVALRTPGDTVSITWAEYAVRVQSIAAGLAALGVRQGDTVALMLSSRPEFHLVDTAIMHLGAVPFPLSSNAPPRRVAHLIKRTRTRVVVTEAALLGASLGSGASPKHVVCVDGASAGAIGLDEVESLGDPRFDFDKAWRRVAPDDVCLLVPTSDALGKPELVRLTHGEAVAQAARLEREAGIEFGDRVTSHRSTVRLADRLSAHYAQMVYGLEVTDVADAEAVVAALTDVRPTIWVAMPGEWAMMRSKVEALLSEPVNPATRALRRFAMSLGRRKVRSERWGNRLGPVSGALWWVVDRWVLGKMRASIGFDELRWGMSGATALDPETLSCFRALNITVCERT